MTDREKLREKIDYLQKVFMEDDDYDYFNEFLADRLLADKDIIVPPCKVGDKLYCITNLTHAIAETVVIGMWIADGTFSILTIHGNIIDDSIGKTVFLTKEEAEEKLKELNK